MERNRRIFIFVGILISIVLTSGIIKLNTEDKNTAISQEFEDAGQDIEKVVEKPNIPDINPMEDKQVNEEVEDNEDKTKKLEGNIENEKIQENKEKEKMNISEISKPKKEKLPEEMEKPITKPKPEEPLKPIEEKIDDKSNPPTTKEEPKKEVKGVTGEDGVVRDLEGNPTGLKPAENIKEIKGEDLLPEGENIGEGDKF